MIGVFKINGDVKKVDFSEGIDISIPIEEGFATVNCFYAPPARFESVRSGEFVGSTALGGSVNFKNVFFNPHGNGTHTECVGHISKEAVRLDECLREFLYLARVVSVYPRLIDNGDRVIYADSFEGLAFGGERAIVIRTLPNDPAKKYKHYSGTNPCYLDTGVMDLLLQNGIDHLLIDLPSVDREEDGGALAAHHRFWEYPEKKFVKRTITELVYIPDIVDDGLYLLNILAPAFNLDAVPSRPMLYPIL
jgi:arylformamidase